MKSTHTDAFMRPSGAQPAPHRNRWARLRLPTGYLHACLRHEESDDDALSSVAFSYPRESVLSVGTTPFQPASSALLHRSPACNTRHFCPSRAHSATNSSGDAVLNVNMS